MSLRLHVPVVVTRRLREPIIGRPHLARRQAVALCDELCEDTHIRTHASTHRTATENVSIIRAAAVTAIHCVEHDVANGEARAANQPANIVTYMTPYTVYIVYYRLKSSMKSI